MKKTFFVIFLLIQGALAFSQIIFVAPDGLLSNSGLSIDAPTTWASAFSKLENAQASTLYFRGGEYMISQRINLNRSGNATTILKIYAYENEKPIFNASRIPVAGDSECLRVKGSYYHIKGVEVKNAYSFGIRISGNYNIIENCVAHHNGGTGIGIQLSHCDTNPNGTLAAYNLIKNCDSYMNFSWYSSSIGGNADGFCASLGVGKGNKFIGCRSWSNSDDGWDLFKSLFEVEIDSCWTWGNGKWSDFVTMYNEKTGKTLTKSSFSGDGNGFKMGGEGDGGVAGCYYESKGLKILRNSVSFNNAVTGITQNSHKDGVLIEKNVSFNNAKNIRFYQAGNEGVVFTFTNNIIFGTGTAESGITNVVAVSTGNSWQSGQPVYTAADFVTVSINDAIAAREADGSLPRNNFGVLKKDVLAVKEVKVASDFFYYSNNVLHMLGAQQGSCSIFNSTGILLKRFSINESISSIDLSDLDKGIFLICLNNDKTSVGAKIIR